MSCLQIKLSMCKPPVTGKEISFYKDHGDHYCDCNFFRKEHICSFSHRQIRDVLSRLIMWKLFYKDSCSDEQDRFSGLLLCYLKIVQYIEISNRAGYLTIMSVHYQLHAG